MKDLLCDQFQETVGEYLIRHRSILDIMAKLQEANSRTNRAITKAVTSCGCVKITADRQVIPPDIDLAQVKEHMHNHLNGQLCEHCREVLENELGNTLFYLAALSNSLNLNLYDILLKEHKKLAALGVFNFA
ncbi:MAG: hypothetical protein K0R39_1802 [Symbiobacteriaceae bacterium]|jgi:hypothetical protein|nr:hypothetical protein [Symbiobacteriaceae bacterium]